MDRVVIKIGSLLLAQKDGGLNHGFIARLAEDVSKLKADGKKVAIVSSGAVSSGRTAKPLQGKFSVNEGKQTKQMVREQLLAGVGQPGLMSVYANEFGKYGITCAQVLVTRADFADRGHYVNLHSVIENYLRLGIVPIFNENDVLSTEELDFSDNDQLACVVAAMLVAERLIILTNVDGVYDRSPGDPEAQIIPKITDVAEVIGQVKDVGKNKIGKGGMKSKLLAADLITSLGIPMYIANGAIDQVILKIILGQEKIGTYIPAKGEKMKPIKTWLSMAVNSKGKIVVSTYLADILRQKQVASVLLAGIEDTEGRFEKNDVVTVCDVDGTELGKGQVRYDSDRLQEEIRQHKKSYASGGAKLEGGKKIAIHYNYFVFS